MDATIVSLFIPIVAIVSPFVFVIIQAIQKERTRRDRIRLKAEIMAKAIENGATIPENFFDEPVEAKKKTTRQVLQVRSLILFALGAAGCISHLINPNIIFVQIGILFILLGAALMAGSFIMKDDKTEDDKETTR